MTTLQITLTLSDPLADQANEEGLLNEDAIVQLIQQEVERRQSVKQLFDAADRLSALDIPPLSPEEIETEVRLQHS